ncbi:DUF6932 family protein [Brachybacterium kimchii]|uniref:Polymerase nucleotidyl transferase domain-containing protein n=1 Tax=Brachybacterium kimchii TaxID=2942909 RepID=A0ABY4N814_9MICO|nr:hypothetical protein [Brachybacterium kimchii]UQN30696.1 hypothetical protein M4486_05170 [Brachybacterium kimchii]
MSVDADGLRALQDPGTGKLTPGVHQTSFGALQDYAVTTPHRARIWHAFEIWRELAIERYEPVRFWFGGSFITDRQPPGDLDVLAWTPVGRIENLRADGHRSTFELQTLQHIDFKAVGDERLTQLDRLQPMGGLVDGFAVSETLMYEKQWQRGWGNDWEDTGELIPGTEKGIVEVIV